MVNACLKSRLVLHGVIIAMVSRMHGLDSYSYTSGFSFSQFVACMPSKIVYRLRLLSAILIVEALVPDACSWHFLHVKYSLVWVSTITRNGTERNA